MNRFSALVNLPTLDAKPASIVHTLHQDLLSLPVGQPYRFARLYRIADQLEYVLQHWPEDNSPSSTIQRGETVQHKASLLPQLAHLKAVLLLQHLPPETTLDQLQAELLGLVKSMG